MPNPETKELITNEKVLPGRAHVALFIFGLFSPLLTFLLAVSGLSYGTRIAGLTIIALVYLTIGIWSFSRMRRWDDRRAGEHHLESESAATSELEDKLLALEEASQFFGASLQPPDMFRLVASRVREIYPFASALLLVPEENGTKLKIWQADGFEENDITDKSHDIGGCLAGMALLSGEISAGWDRLIQTIRMPITFDDKNISAVAIPMRHEGEVFAILQLIGTKDEVPDAAMMNILDAVSERIAPLFIGSLAFERSLSSALTDGITKLPNERAFFMVLETQLAESQRFRGERPLTILAADIKGFAEANENFGYAAGDRMLGFVAEAIGSQLRKMDFLARSVNDEFVIILPTATEHTALEVIERIKEKLAETPFAVTEQESAKLWLNFGWATFWKDGETAKQLLQTAVLRKQQAKSSEPATVVWFPKDYVN